MTNRTVDITDDKQIVPIRKIGKIPYEDRFSCVYYIEDHAGGRISGVYKTEAEAALAIYNLNLEDAE